MFETSQKSSINKRPLRILFVNFSYVIDVYQRKLEIASKLGNVKLGVLAPRKWKMKEWNKSLALVPLYSQITYFPANVWFLNGVHGGHLYPIQSPSKTITSFKPDILQVEHEVFALVTFQLAHHRHEYIKSHWSFLAGKTWIKIFP